MIVYVAHYSYPDYPNDPDPGMGSLIGVGTEWNKTIKMVMENHDHLDFYDAKVKVNDYTWRIRIDGDLYVDIVKCELDVPLLQSQ